MNPGSATRLFLGCAFGALIGGVWNASGDARPFASQVLTGVFVLAAYIAAWRIGDDR